jgi:hypothetical protein
MNPALLVRLVTTVTASTYKGVATRNPTMYRVDSQEIPPLGPAPE